MNIIGKLHKHILLIQNLLIFSWLSFLVKSDSIYMPYLAIGLCGLFCAYKNKGKNYFQKNRRCTNTIVLSSLYSIIVLMANYPLIKQSNYPEGAGKLVRLFQIGILFMGGSISSGNILFFLADKFCSFTYEKGEINERCKAAVVFLGTMSIVSVVNITFLLLAKYPGILTSDSLSQIQQIKTGEYSNHHPFYHTMIIKFFLSIGWTLFGNINASVALYNVFQIFFMACCIAFAMLTLYQMNVPVKYIALCVIWYTAMPFHIMYSFTMWKNIMFGGAFLLFITTIFRILNNIKGCLFANYLLFVISGIGICLLQSNGWPTFLLIFTCFILLFPKRHIKLNITFICIIISTYVLSHDVLIRLGCHPTDIVDSLSIPAQQIARVIAEGNRLTEKQIYMLEQIIDVDQIANKYKPYISDPIKSLLFAKGNQRYIAENKTAWLKLYMEIGLSHPREYMEAWIDQTKGYWNGGYVYWRWADVIDENEIGISRIVYCDKVNEALNIYLWSWSNIEPLQIFLCIGFYVWGAVVLAYLCIIRENKQGLFICAATLTSIVSLWISTPVYSEFRYAYAMLCCFPVLVFTTFY